MEAPGVLIADQGEESSTGVSACGGRGPTRGRVPMTVGSQSWGWPGTRWLRSQCLRKTAVEEKGRGLY